MPLPTEDTPAIRLRFAALGEALLAQFPGRIAQLDCGPGRVAAFWVSPGPTPQEAAAFQATVDGWAWGEQPDERLERLTGFQRASAAAILRASSQWAGLSAARKARIMAIIDAAAARIIDAL